MRISDHAFERVLERLGWGHEMFSLWVETTCQGWAKMSAQYFQAHQVHVVGADHNETLYRCPLDEGRALCLVVADSTLVTVIIFDLLPGEGLRIREIQDAKPVSKAEPKVKKVHKINRDVKALKTQLGELRSTIDKVDQVIGTARAKNSQIMQTLQKLSGFSEVSWQTEESDEKDS